MENLSGYSLDRFYTQFELYELIRTDMNINAITLPIVLYVAIFVFLHRTFIRLSLSPFIIQQHYGFSPFAFSICFAVNAVAIGVAAALSVKFRRTENGTLTGCIGMLVLAVLQMAALYSGCDFWTHELLMFALLFMMGLTFTASTTLAMDCERRYAGAASALLGALCFASGGIVSPLVGLGDILISTGVTFVICAVCSLLCALWAVKRTGRKLHYAVFSTCYMTYLF